MPVVPPLETGHYLLYQEVAEYMRAIEEAAPHLVRLFSIGTSYEGRPLLLAEVTNRATGEGLEKPALWLDGNLRGAELAGSSACLEVLRQLASGYGRDATVTGLLDRYTFYVVPRVSPDGAEHCLTTGELVRSGTRPYPAEDSRPSMSICDINGDGRVLQMRVEDPLGEWKVSKRDPRLLVRRAPDDMQGPFYRLYREGFWEGQDGPIHVASPRCQLDFDCNFPCDWRPEEEQPGAGPYPLSEPETRAVVDFFRTHPNLCLAITCHSLRGAVVRPYACRPDTELEDSDRALYREFGRRVEELCGYPLRSALESANGRKSHGSFLDWAYHHAGILAFSPQMWCLGRAAGLEVADPLNFLEERSEPENVALLRWLDRELQGHGFLPWTGFEHPQLGYVEIGGWDLLHAWLNPPPGAYLRDEVDRCSRLVLGLAGALPRLGVAGCQEEVVGWADAGEAGQAQPLRKVVLEYENQGYLPTWVTGLARQRNLAGPLEVRCSTDADTELLLGLAFQHGGQLAGFGSVHTDEAHDAVFFDGASERQRGRLEWLVRGEGPVHVELRHDRAGSVVVVSRLERAVPVLPESRPTRAPAAPAPLAPPPAPPARPVPAAAQPRPPAPPPATARPAPRPAAAPPSRSVTPPAVPQRPLPTPPQPPPRPGAAAPVRPAHPSVTAPAVASAAAGLGPGLAAPVAQMMAAEASPPSPPTRPPEPPPGALAAPVGGLPKGRVLGSPPARPGANFATQAQEMVAARREGEPSKPPGLPVPPARPASEGDAFSPGLVLRPAFPPKGAGPGRPAEPPPASIPPDIDAPPEAPAAESRLPALFLRQRRKEK